MTEKNIQKINNELTQWSNGVNLEDMNANEGFEVFHTQLISILDKVAPEKK